MSLAPLFQEPPVIVLHAVAALAALLVGAAQLAGPKGARVHRLLGYLWALIMLLIAGSSLWIHEIRLLGSWSPIHLLSILTLVSLPLAVWAAHCHQVERHRRAMTSLFVFALVIARAFTLLPGRVMHAVVLGS